MVTPRSVEESVTDTLREAILRGDLVPGQRLAQVEFAAELGVSRVPLRDALRRLEAEGLVEIGRRGARVSSLTADDVNETYEMRMMLEPECARRAVRALDDEAAQHLIELSREMDRTAADPIVGAQARQEFYAEFYRYAARPRMWATINQLRALVQRYHLLGESIDNPHGHEALRACIRERDAEKAAEIVRAHLEAARNDLMATLRGSTPKAAADTDVTSDGAVSGS
jgi:DNA-binding GntR family transcriptional regulator